MARKDGVEEAGKKEAQAARRFTKQQLLASARYRDRRDLVSALLEDGKAYTIAEVGQMVDRFMKGKVR